MNLTCAVDSNIANNETFQLTGTSYRITLASLKTPCLVFSYIHY